MTGAEIVREFLRWMQKHQPELSQAEMARKAGIGQSWINKVALGGSIRFPDVDMCHKLFRAYPDDWITFLRAHPTIVRELRELFDWAFIAERPLPTPGLPTEISACEVHLKTILRTPKYGHLVLSAIEQLAIIFRSPKHGRMAVEQLKNLAAFVIEKVPLDNRG